MEKLEVLSPVGSPESLISAVRSGADAVYLGAKSFSARRNATNFAEQELSETVRYCHIRGVKVYVTVNIMIKESELSEAMDLVRYLNEINVDGLIVQDLGLSRLIHQAFPDLPIHGSTQMSVSSVAALPLLKEMGFERIVVAREMSREQLKEFCQKAKEIDMEVEYFVHGALCMSVSGQCLLSAMIGSRSGNRGLCAQACRLPFKVDKGTGYDLSLKDSSLFRYAKELQQMGVASLKIEGRMKRPEYISMATKCCRDAVDGKQYDDTLLKNVFSRSGFTAGYYNHELGKQMFGTRTKEDVDASSDSFNKIHEIYRVERQSVAVDMTLVAKKNEKLQLTISDENNTIVVMGDEALEATNKSATVQELTDGLSKLGNTPFYLRNCEIDLEDGLFIRNSSIKSIRRDAIEQLQNEREKVVVRRENDIDYATSNRSHSLNKLIVRLANIQQLPENTSNISAVIVPIDSVYENIATEVIVEIDRWINSESYVEKRLEYFKSKGCKKAYCNSLSAISLAKRHGFEVIGGNYLNVANSDSAKQLECFGASSITTSVELDVEEINSIQVSGEKGVIGYGRIPLMLLVNCPMKNGRDCSSCDKKGYITDRKGIKFPIRCHLGVSELLNSTPIYLADKMDDFRNVDYMILYFTIETKEEVEEIISSYLKEEKVLKDYTRGLYYRSVL